MLSDVEPTQSGSAIVRTPIAVPTATNNIEPTSIRAVSQHTVAPSCSTHTPDPLPDAPPLTARTLRYRRRIAARNTTDSTHLAPSTNSHDHQADFPPAQIQIPIADRSPVVPTAYQNPTAVTYMPLTTPSGPPPFPTVDRHLVHHNLPPFPSRASTSMASSADNKITTSTPQRTALAAAGTYSSAPFSFLAPIWSTLSSTDQATMRDLSLIHI